MIVLLRSTDGNPDSRLQKYIDALSQNGIFFRVFCWDRENKYQDRALFSYFKKRACYGSGWRNVRYLVGFNIFLFKQLWSYRKEYSVIHACDFDTIFPAIIMKLFFRKKIIYDIFDWYIDSRELSKSVVSYIILACEFMNLKLADLTIICEEERRKQIHFVPKRLWILPNIPYFQKDITISSPKNNKIRIAYVGVFARHRGLEKIVKYAEENPEEIDLDVAGFGELLSLIAEKSQCCHNIHYHGTVSYSDGLELMGQSDLIWAVYEKTIDNHIYAAPNKYYEGLFLGKPIVTTSGTYVGIKTEKYHTGFVIEEKYEDLCSFFKRERLYYDIDVFGNNAKRIWIDKYANYVECFMKKKYIPFLIQ